MDSLSAQPAASRFSRWVVRIDGWIAATTTLSRPRAWAITMLGVALAGLGDYATGTDLWFGPIYLLVLCMPAWALGWRAALLAAGPCVALSVAANGVSAYPLGHTAIVWNIAMRVLAVAIIVFLMDAIRRAHDREWHRARTDSLTGLMNEQAFYECAAAISRGRSWGVLAYADLDGFKQVNDRHGHAAGDRALCAFADGVREAVPAGNAFARVGGDEFLLFLPVNSESEGYRLAELLHARMRESGAPNGFGCSVGALVVHLAGAAVDKASVDAADRLMYKAKSEGSSLRIVTYGTSRSRRLAPRIVKMPAPLESAA
jgi:diguanylate cyclase (GGDEF)-like protein